MDRHTAIDELIRLAADADSATELGSLRPLYFRVDEIAKSFPSDAEVQDKVSELKQLLVVKGTRLKEQAITSSSNPISGSMRVPAESPGMPNPGFGRPSASTIITPPSGELRIPPPPGSGNIPVPPPPPGSGSTRVPSSPTAGAFSVPPPTGIAPVPAAKPVNVQSALWKGVALGVAGFLLLFVLFVNYMRNNNPPDGGREQDGGTGGSATISVDVQTTPPGASIQVNGAEKGISNCKVDLPPGNYTILASLDGYDTVATGVTVAAGMPPVVINLTQQAQPLRISADWTSGKVTIDNEPPQDLKDGQFLLERVNPGQHTVVVQSPMGQASFSFAIAPGKNPEITAPPTAKDALVVLMSTSSKQARMYTSSGPLKLQLEGQSVGQVDTAGFDFKDVKVGDREVHVGEGKDLKKMFVSFSPSPMLTAYIKSDLNIGNLVVVAGQESDVNVLINGRLYTRTMRGLARIQLPPGRYGVKVAKEGFEASGEQAAEIKKGEDSKLEFRLKELPKVSSLKITNATPGATVAVDKTPIGRVGPDGTFSGPISSLGDKEVELSMTGYLPRRILKTFKGGDTVTINDMQLTQALAGARIVVLPAGTPANVQMKRDGEATSRQVSGEVTGLQPGAYTFTATSRGFKDEVVKVNLVGGETRPVEITLRKDPTGGGGGGTSTQPTPRPLSITDFDGGSLEGGALIIPPNGRSAARVAPGSGTYAFKISGEDNRRLRWYLAHPDGKVDQFEIYKGKFNVAGRRVQDVPKGSEYNVQLEVGLNQIIVKINGAVAYVLPDPSRTMSGGRLTFIGDKGDPMSISGFNFRGGN